MSSHRSKVHFSQYHSHICVYVCMFVKVRTEFIGMMTQPLFLNPITCRISFPLFDNGNGKTALSHIWHNISPISWVTQHHLQGFLVFHPSSFLPSFLLPSFLSSIFFILFLEKLRYTVISQYHDRLVSETPQTPKSVYFQVLTQNCMHTWFI